jgi:hypothetical protein
MGSTWSQTQAEDPRSSPESSASQDRRSCRPRGYAYADSAPPAEQGGARERVGIILRPGRVGMIGDRYAGSRPSRHSPANSHHGRPGHAAMPRMPLVDALTRSRCTPMTTGPGLTVRGYRVSIACVARCATDCRRDRLRRRGAPPRRMPSASKLTRARAVRACPGAAQQRPASPCRDLVGTSSIRARRHTDQHHVYSRTPDAARAASAVVWRRRQRTTAPIDLPAPRFLSQFIEISVDLLGGIARTFVGRTAQIGP